jgi:hypothetical protein|tara:strand:- start:956 stop:2119 length:1164 start_codon:yes stop_codon:yes gene_type:complete
MVRTASLFSQLLDVFPRLEFQKAVRDHKAEYYAKGFTCWDQFVAMLFCQLAQAHSLREICDGLSCCLGKLAHLGMRDAPKRSTLSYANIHRPWELYETVFYQLVEKCCLFTHGKTKFRFRNKLLSLDATVIDLCLELFPWAKFRQRKGAIKLHLLLDHDGYLPTFALITEGAVHEVKVAQELALPADSIVVIDRGFVDYELFGHWCSQDVFFVTRQKSNAVYEVVEKRQIPQNRGVLSDEIIRLTGIKAKEACPHLLRRIVFQDKGTDKEFVFLTNHLKFGPTTIAKIYKDRWQIELFFKALKQNLKVKTFVGTTPNALKIQIWTALITMLLLKYLQLRSRLNWHLSNLVALLRWNLFTYRNLWDWINNPFETPPLIPKPVQLKLRL